MRFLLASLSLVLACCASPEDPVPESSSTERATPDVPDGAEPPAALERALLGLYGPDDGEVRYLWGEADLDGDGSPEVLAHVVGPLVCGSGGCATLVFTPDGDGLRLVGDVTVSRPPVVALAERTDGWRDLAVAVGGGGAEGGFARLRFDGAAYPGNPTVEPAQRIEGEPEGTTVIEPFDGFEDARPLR